MTELYRLAYTSRNLIKGSEAEIAATVSEILATSQSNNMRVGVTGALLFNGGYFAQVLEGPRTVVETTFERLQRDRRHSDVNVLQCEAVAMRGFPNWSMAFVGRSTKGQALWSEMASRTGFDLSQIEGEDLFATLHAIVLAEEDLGDDEMCVAKSIPELASAPSRKTESAGLNVDRLQAELQNAFSPQPPEGAAHRSNQGTPTRIGWTPPAAAEASAEVAVLRAALCEERQRTSDLRRELDEARIALCTVEGKAAALQTDRDMWGDWIRALAHLLSEHPSHTKARPAAEIGEVA